MEQSPIAIVIYAKRDSRRRCHYSRNACLGMLSVHVDHALGEEESRYAIAVDSNFVQLITLHITSGCRGSL